MSQEQPRIHDALLHTTSTRTTSSLELDNAREWACAHQGKERHLAHHAEHIGYAVSTWKLRRVHKNPHVHNEDLAWARIGNRVSWQKNDSVCGVCACVCVVVVVVVFSCFDDPGCLCQPTRKGAPNWPCACAQGP